MALVLLVFIAADTETSALDRLRRARQEGPGGTIKSAPSIDPRRLKWSASSPRFWSIQSSEYHVLARIARSVSKSLITRRNVALRTRRLRRNSQALADPRRQRHIAVVVDHEAHQRWSFVAMSFKSWQADFADGEGVQVGQENSRLQRSSLGAWTAPATSAPCWWK